jgi:hypothetical protein
VPEAASRARKQSREGSIKMAAGVKVLGIAAILGLTLAIVHIIHSDDRDSVLLEVDGIPLDSNAAAVLGGRQSRRTRGFGPPDPNDKMLHAQEAGELDGIALDKNAASLLKEHPTLHLKTFSALPTVKHVIRRRAGVNVPAQRYLESGEADLSAGMYGSAVRLLKKARRLWKGQHSGNSHFAETLIYDIEKAHPTADHSRHLGPTTSNYMKATSNRGRITEGMRSAAKKLSNGKEFRSLYGLMRDQHHENRGSAESEFSPQSGSHSARTTLLSEKKQNPHSDRLASLIRNELSRAEKQLVRHNKMILLHEKDEILKSAKNLVSTSSHQPSLEQPVGSLAAAPVLSWSSNQVPPSLKLAWNPTTQLSAEPAGLSPPAASQPPQYDNPQQQQTISTKDSQQLAEKPDYNQELAQKAEGNPPVPVINLNLPPGEKLPPGRYALDGSVVPDAAGQLDFVGNLVRVSPPGVL